MSASNAGLLSVQQFQYQLSRTPTPSRFHRTSHQQRPRVHVTYEAETPKASLVREDYRQPYVAGSSNPSESAVITHPRSQPIAANRRPLNLEVSHGNDALKTQTRQRPKQLSEIPESPPGTQAFMTPKSNELPANATKRHRHIDSDNETLQDVLREKRLARTNQSQPDVVLIVDSEGGNTANPITVIRRGILGAQRRKLPEGPNLAVGNNGISPLSEPKSVPSDHSGELRRSQFNVNLAQRSGLLESSNGRRQHSPELGEERSRLEPESPAAAGSAKDRMPRTDLRQLNRPKRKQRAQHEQAATSTAPDFSNPSGSSQIREEEAVADGEDTEVKERSRKRRRRQRCLPVTELELTEVSVQAQSPPRQESGLEGAEHDPIEEHDPGRCNAGFSLASTKRLPPKRLSKTVKKPVLGEQSPSEGNTKAFKEFKVLKYPASRSTLQNRRCKSRFADGFEGIDLTPTIRNNPQPKGRKRRAPKQQPRPLRHFPQLELVDSSQHNASHNLENSAEVLTEDEPGDVHSGFSHNCADENILTETEPTFGEATMQNIQPCDSNAAKSVSDEAESDAAQSPAACTKSPNPLETAGSAKAPNIPDQSCLIGNRDPNDVQVTPSNERQNEPSIQPQPELCAEPYLYHSTEADVTPAAPDADHEPVKERHKVDCGPSDHLIPSTSPVTPRRQAVKVVTSIEYEDDEVISSTPAPLTRLKSNLRNMTSDQLFARTSSQNSRTGRRVTFSEEVMVSTIHSPAGDSNEGNEYDSESDSKCDFVVESPEPERERLEGDFQDASSSEEEGSDGDSGQSSSDHSEDESLSSQSKSYAGDTEIDGDGPQSSSDESDGESSGHFETPAKDVESYGAVKGYSNEPPSDDILASRSPFTRMRRSLTSFGVDNGADTRPEGGPANDGSLNGFDEVDNEDLLAEAAADGGGSQSRFFGDGALCADEEMILEASRDLGAPRVSPALNPAEKFVLGRRQKLQRACIGKWRWQLRSIPTIGTNFGL